MIWTQYLNLLKKIEHTSNSSLSTDNFFSVAIKEVKSKGNPNVSYNIKKSFKIKIVYNKNFSRGMSSSIILGLKNINKKSKGVLVCLSDMPKIKMLKWE